MDKKHKISWLDKQLPKISTKFGNILVDIDYHLVRTRKFQLWLLTKRWSLKINYILRCLWYPYLYILALLISNKDNIMIIILQGLKIFHINYILFYTPNLLNIALLDTNDTNTMIIDTNVFDIKADIFVLKTTLK